MHNYFFVQTIHVCRRTNYLTIRVGHTKSQQVFDEIVYDGKLNESLQKLDRRMCRGLSFAVLRQSSSRHADSADIADMGSIAPSTGSIVPQAAPAP